MQKGDIRFENKSHSHILLLLHALEIIRMRKIAKITELKATMRMMNNKTICVVLEFKKGEESKKGFKI